MRDLLHFTLIGEPGTLQNAILRQLESFDNLQFWDYFIKKPPALSLDSESPSDQDDLSMKIQRNLPSSRTDPVGAISCKSNKLLVTFSSNRMNHPQDDAWIGRGWPKLLNGKAHSSPRVMGFCIQDEPKLHITNLRLMSWLTGYRNIRSHLKKRVLGRAFFRFPHHANTAPLPSMWYPQGLQRLQALNLGCL